MEPIDLDRRRLALLFALTGVVAGCGGSGSSGNNTPSNFTPGPPPPGAAPATAVTFRDGLENPWGMAWLPDGRILVTERPGRMRIVSADGSTLSSPLGGVPAVHAVDQGGLLDVAVAPDFATAPWVYFSFSEEDGNGDSGTAVARGQLSGNALTNVSVIFSQTPKLGGSGHYGGRLVFADDGTLLVTLGERQTDDPSNPGTGNAQNLANHLGKVVRIHRDGSTPSNNPFAGTAGALAQIYSRGHRNPQGAALHPVSRELWLNEHGPQGGDEINRVLPGRNYGWPLRSYGCPYGATPGPACQVNGGTHAPNYEEPQAYWVPTSTAPSGMMFYTGDRFPEWRGSLFVGALSGKSLWRFPVDGNTLGARQQHFTGLNERIRDVRQGPDGWIYLLTDSASGRIVRIQR